MTLATTKILHIGYPKTGTTTLQRGLFSRVHELGLVDTFISLDANRNPDFIYELGSAVVPSVFSPIKVSKRLDDYLKEPRFKSFLVSNEMLLNRGDPKELAARLRATFGPELKILITFREPLEILVSGFQQRVKFGWVTDFEKHMEAFTPLLLDVRRTIDEFASQFESVIAVKNSELDNEVWIKALFQTGHDLLIAGKSSDARNNLNPGISAKKVHQMIRINRFLLPLLRLTGYRENLNYVPFIRLSFREKMTQFIGRAMQFAKKEFAERTSHGPKLTVSQFHERHGQIMQKYRSISDVRDIEIWDRGAPVDILEEDTN